MVEGVHREVNIDLVVALVRGKVLELVQGKEQVAQTDLVVQGSRAEDPVALEVVVNRVRKEVHGVPDVDLGLEDAHPASDTDEDQAVTVPSQDTTDSVLAAGVLVHMSPEEVDWLQEGRA